MKHHASLVGAFVIGGYGETVGFAAGSFEGKAHRFVERDRGGVHRGRDAVNFLAAEGGGRLEEVMVEESAKALPALSRRDADKVDVGDGGIGLRAQANEEGLEAGASFEDEAGGTEMLEEEAREEMTDGAAPPLVDDGSDEVEVAGLEVADGHGQSI